MLRVRHAVRLALDVVHLASGPGSWWIAGVVLVLLVLTFAVTAANAAVPYAVYTLF